MKKLFLIMISMMLISVFSLSGHVDTKKNSTDKWQKMLQTGEKTSKIKKDTTVFVVSFHPQGKLRRRDELDEINITFSSPVIPLQRVKNNKQQLITITPAIKGNGYWKSSTTYCYVFKDKLRSSAKYTVRFKGYKKNGNLIAPEKSWDFYTPSIKILRTKPYYNANHQLRDQRILVHFTEPVKPEDIKEYIKIKSKNSLFDEDIDYSIDYCNKKQRELLYYWKNDPVDFEKFVVITPLKKYGIASNVEVMFYRGLKSIDGDIGLPGNRVLKFRTYDYFKFISIDKEFNPEEGIFIKFTNSVNIKGFLEFIKITPKVKIYKNKNWNSRGFRIEGNFKPDTEYRLEFPAGIKDIYGNKLKEGMSFKIKSKDYIPYLLPPSGTHFVLESYLKKDIPVSVRNIFTTDVYYKELSDLEIGTIVDKGFNKLEIPDKECNKYTWKIPIKKNISYTIGFDLKKIGITKPGFYYIKFSNSTRYYYKGSVFQLTDTALIAKYSPTQIFVTGFSMDSGKINKTDYKLYDFKNTIIKSNNSGIALFNAKTEDFMKKSIFNAKIFSLNNKAFIYGKKDEMFDIWDYEYNYNLIINYDPMPLYNHLLLFTEKKLYKANQTVKFKGILRHIVAGVMKTPIIYSVSGVVYNSREQKIKQFSIAPKNISAFGTFSDSFKLPKDAPSGFYRIDFSVKTKSGKIDKELSFSVQEYKPAKFEVKAKFNRNSMIAGEDITGFINAKYLFGTPMKNAEGKLNIRLKNTSFTPKGWEGFSFGDYDSKLNKTILSKDIELNEKGIFDFELKSLTYDSKNSAVLGVYGEVKDKDNIWINKNSSIIVHRGQYYIGLKTSSYFFEKNKKDKFFIITVNPNGKLFTKKEVVDLNIKKIEWRSFQKKDASGALRWNWEKVKKDIINKKIEISNGKTEFEYGFDKTGYYEITLKGRDELNNTIITKGNLYVTGSGFVSWKLDEGRIIELITDKDKYKKGEDIKLLIKSPFKESTALITVEREKVYWSKTVRLVGNTNTVNIPVSEEFLPNIYINVIILKERKDLEEKSDNKNNLKNTIEKLINAFKKFVRWDKNGKDIGKPEFYSGYKKVKIDTEQKKLTVNIEKDKLYYAPGQTVNFKINVKDNNGNGVKTELCIAVVDKGVLNLTGYRLPNPFNFFYTDRPLDVKTVSTLNDVLARRKYTEKGENPGGGTDGGEFGSIIARKNFKETVYYSAFVKTDKNGKAELSFKLADNLTTFRAMVVSVDKKDKFGYGELDILVKKELILKPAMPYFLRLNDRFTGGVTVTNNSDKNRNVKVKTDFSGIELMDRNDVKTIVLEPSETKSVLFDFKKGSDSISPEFTFKAISGSFSDGYNLKIPLRRQLYSESTANFGKVNDKKVKESIVVPSNSLREQDKLEISLSSSSIIGVKKNLDSLNKYPYNCLEQKISKTTPYLFDEFLKKYSLTKIGKNKIDDKIINLLKVVGDYQTVNGGFKYYPDSYFVNSYLSCYVTEFMLNAKDKGFRIDKNILEKSENYLRRICKNTSYKGYPYSNNIFTMIQAYALFVLSKDNIFLNDALNNLYEIRDRVPLEGINYLIRALDKNKKMPDYMKAVLTKILLNKMKDEPTKTHFENYEDRYWWTVHGSSIRTTSTVLETLLEVYGRFPYAEKIARWLATKQNQKRYLSTQENVFMLRSFEKYYQVFEKDTPDFIAKVLFNGIKKIEQKFSMRTKKASLHSIKLQDYRPNQKVDIDISKKGKGILYYLLRLTYYPTDKLKPLERGFSIKKTFYDLSGNMVNKDEFKAGNKYIVNLEISTNKERSFVMVTDPIPAGFKVLNPAFKTSSELDKNKVTKYSKFGAYWGVFYRTEFYFDRVQLFADYLRRGTHKWQYLVMATNSGIYTVSPSTVSEMYNPEVFGRDDNKKIIIK